MAPYMGLVYKSEIIMAGIINPYPTSRFGAFIRNITLNKSRRNIAIFFDLTSVGLYIDI